MKILLINKSDKTGGAAIACNRLKIALNKNGVYAQMLVQEKLSDDVSSFSVLKGKLGEYYSFLLFAIERFYFTFFEASKKVRFAFSPANTGLNISKNKLVKEADIIHLHWFNQGFLSIKNLEQILKLNKPVVWTLHDMWAFTGGCHYVGDCTNYKNNCGNCKFLKKSNKTDLSNKIFKQKLKLYSKYNISIVTCSKWLKEKAEESKLFSNYTITNIPNPIDQAIFKKKDKKTLRTKLNLPANKKLILFGSANIMDKRKGFDYLNSALINLANKKEQLTNEVELVVFGKSDKEFLSSIPFKCHDLGMINSPENIADVYNIADMFVLPSLEDNLPNTIMESLACGTPVVAFNTGGIPEMIDHKKNGYLSEYKSVADLEKGIEYIIHHKNPEFLSSDAIKKVDLEYNEKVVAEKYIQIY